jgi:hypothetical protein
MRTALGLFLATAAIGLTSCHRDHQHVTLPCACAHAQQQKVQQKVRLVRSASPEARHHTHRSESAPSTHLSRADQSFDERSSVHGWHDHSMASQEDPMRSHERRTEREWHEHSMASQEHAMRLRERRGEPDWHEHSIESQEYAMTPSEDDTWQYEQQPEHSEFSREPSAAVWIDGFGRPRLHFVVDVAERHAHRHCPGTNDTARLDPWAGYNPRLPDNGY